MTFVAEWKSKEHTTTRGNKCQATGPENDKARIPPMKTGTIEAVNEKVLTAWSHALTELLFFCANCCGVISSDLAILL